MSPDEHAAPETRDGAVCEPVLRRIRTEFATELGGSPRLYPMPPWVRSWASSAFPWVTVVGDMWTLGTTDRGMHEHADAPYQGGTMTLLVYLTTPEKGGDTVFEPLSAIGKRISPRAGRIVTFGTYVRHRAEAVVSGHKRIAAFEVRRKCI